MEFQHPFRQQNSVNKFGLVDINMSHYTEQPIGVGNTTIENVMSTINVTTDNNNDTRDAINAIYRLQFAICSMGIVGNLLAFCVLLRRKFRQTSYGFLLAILALSDMTILIVGGGRHATKNVFNLDDIRKVNSGLCMAQRFILYYSLDLSAWIMATVTIERYITFGKPFKKLHGCFSKKRSALVLVAVLVLVFAKNMHLLFTGSYDVIGGKRKCSYKKEHIAFINKYFHIIVTAMYVLGPFVIMLVFNILTIKALWKAFKFFRVSTDLVTRIQRKNIQVEEKRIKLAKEAWHNLKSKSLNDIHLSPTKNSPLAVTGQTRSVSANQLGVGLRDVNSRVTSSPILKPRSGQGGCSRDCSFHINKIKHWNRTNYDRRERNTWHTTLMCVIVTTAFLLLASPSFINMNVEKFTKYVDPLRSAIVLLLLYTNHSINFILYMVSGRPFRRNFMRMIRLHRRDSDSSAILAVAPSITESSSCDTPKSLRRNQRIHFHDIINIVQSETKKCTIPNSDGTLNICEDTRL